MAATKTALELAEAAEWAALDRLVARDPSRADEVDDFGMMALHWACTDTHVPLRVVKQLVAANPRAAAQQNKGGLLPLHIAVKAQARLDVLQHLVAARPAAAADETPAGETPAELAQVCGLSADKITLLASAEQRLRAAGDAPARPRGRIVKPHLLSSQQYLEEVQDALSVSTSPPEQPSSPATPPPPLARASTAANLVHALRFPNALAGVPLPPRWRLDKRCNICQLKFSYFKSRHHCRNCGESVCSTHSNCRLPLLHLGLAAPQRVCILCFDELRASGQPSAVVNMFSAIRRELEADAEPEPDMASSLRVRLTRKPPTAGSVAGGPRLRSPSMASVASDRAFAHSARGFRLPLADEPLEPQTVEAELDPADELKVRPRAWTDLEATDKLLERQEQARELEAHADELEQAKRELQLRLERTTGRMHAAVKERLVHERTVAELRDSRIIDITRISLDDEDEDEDGDEDDELAAVATTASRSTGKQRRDDSEETVTLVEDVDVDVAATCKYLGQALLAKGSFSEAVVELRRSVEANRKDPDVWYNLAQALQGAGQLYDAELAAERALSLSAKSYAAMSLLGKILHAKGEHERAIQVFRDALGLMENEEDSDEDIGSMTVGW